MEVVFASLPVDKKADEFLGFDSLFCDVNQLIGVNRSEILNNLIVKIPLEGCKLDIGCFPFLTNHEGWHTFTQFDFLPLKIREHFFKVYLN